MKMIQLKKKKSRPVAAVMAIASLLSYSTVRTFAQQAGVARARTDSQTVKVRIETETVMVTRQTAIPSQITRKSGPFFLELRTQVPDPALNLVLVPEVSISDPSKLTNALDVPALQKRKKSAGIVDLPPGVYQLQVQPSGKTICTISISE